MTMIKNIHPQENEESHELVLQELAYQLAKPVDAIAPSLTQTLISPDHRAATWICLFLALGQAMSGCSVINIYTEQIFQDLAKNGEKSSMSIDT